MPYHVAFDEEDGIIIVTLSGLLEHGDHCCALDEVVQVFQATRSPKILVDMRDLNTVHNSTMDCFIFGEALVKKIPFVRLAHVMPIDNKSKKDIGFISTVVSNRGVSCAEFETLDEAKKWLLECTIRR